MRTNVCAGVWYTKFVKARRFAVGVTVLSVLAFPAQASADQAAAPMTLVAGGNGLGFGGDGGPATSARLDGPHGAAVAPDGTLYIADTGNHRVRAVGADGTITTVAGDGGEDGEDGAVPAGSKATAISLRTPTEVAVARDGTVLVADSGVSRVYAVAPDGSIAVRAEISGPGEQRDIRGLAVAADGTLYVSDRDAGRVLAFAPDGTRSVAAGNGAEKSRTPIAAPGSLATDHHGDLWIAGHNVFRTRAGEVAPVILPKAGRWSLGDPGRWPPAEEDMVDIWGIGAGAAGVYVLDSAARNISWLKSSGELVAITDLPVDPFGVRDPVELAIGPATDARLHLIDTTGSRIFAMKVPPAAPASNEGATPTWTWVAGGLVLVVISAVGVGVVRRRNR